MENGKFFRKEAVIMWRRKGLVTAALAAALVSLPFSAQADDRKYISSISLKVHVDLDPGDSIDDGDSIDTSNGGGDGTYVYTSSSKYSIDSAQWATDTKIGVGDTPKIEVYLDPDYSGDTEYRFRSSYSSSSVSISGGTFVSADRKGDQLKVVLRVNGIKGTFSEPEDAFWDDARGRARWEEGDDDSGYYDVYLYRGSSVVKKLEEYRGNSYNFYPYMTKEGDYTFKVRTVPHTDDEKRYGDKSGWVESGDLYIDEDEVSDGTGQDTGSGASGENAQPVTPPKKYIIPTAGIVEGGPEDWNQYSYSVYCDVDALKSQLKTVFRKDPIPGQPTNKKGKPLSYFVYDQAEVYVDDMDNVKEVQDMITSMGFQAMSNVEWVESSQKQMQAQQAVLGGIGAVSLLVAAIGIANTMMMSIYERTKEIGVMKVLGCDMDNIRDMFLLESGFIGLMGGVLGVLCSYLISKIINMLYLRQQMQEAAMYGTVLGDISRIPLWLVGISLVFAVLVGMLAGFFPAKRAMKLSALSAIRNE